MIMSSEERLSALDGANTILGCMLFGKPAWGVAEREAFEILDVAGDLGIQVFDTANFYAGGASERIIGRWLKNTAAPGVVLMSKAGGRDPEESAISGLSAASLRPSVLRSLDRLGVDRLGAITLHWPDCTVAIDDTLDGICQLLEEHLIEAWNLSNFFPAEFVRMVEGARSRRIPVPRQHQMHLNLLEQTAMYDLVPEARYYQCRPVAWSPLCGGVLCDNFESTQDSRFRDPKSFWARHLAPKWADRREQVVALARGKGVSLSCLALSWLRAIDVVPIVGVTTAAQLRTLLRDPIIPLEVEVLSAIRALQSPSYPFDVLEFSSAQSSRRR